MLSRFPINYIVRLDLACLIKHSYVISVCVFQFSMFYSLSERKLQHTAKKPQKPKEQEAKNNKREKNTKEPRRQKPHTPEKPQLSYKTLLFVLLFFLIDVISYALCLDKLCSLSGQWLQHSAKKQKATKQQKPTIRHNSQNLGIPKATKATKPE